MKDDHVKDDRGAEYLAHDHRAENAVIELIENPTPENAQAAELAVAKLQRAYDRLRLRLDEDTRD